MKAAYFTHNDFVKAGSIDLALSEIGWEAEYFYLNRHAPKKIDWEAYDALFILGGTMHVYEEKNFEFKKAEFQLVEEAMKAQVPILGICFGAQVIASVLGAEVRKHHVPEIGWHEVFPTESGKHDPLIKPFGKKIDVLEWHFDVFDLPKSVEHLAYSRIAPNQAFRYGDKTYAVQFHYEMDLPVFTDSFHGNLATMHEIAHIVDWHAFYHITHIRMAQYQKDAKHFFKQFIEITTNGKKVR